jgi:23S rRNA (guanosine2251-2'-O)-methyltransferase
MSPAPKRGSGKPRGGSSSGRPGGARGGSSSSGGPGGARGGPSSGGGRGPARPRGGGPPKPPQGPRPKRRSVPRGAEATPATEAREKPDVLYGRNPVFEAMRAGRREVQRIWATAGAAKEPWLEGVLVEPADGDWLTQRAGSDAHQGIVADVGPYPYADPAELLRGAQPLIVALDEVQDPRNLGAIARSAEAAGASGIVIPRHRSAEVTAAAAKASAGAVEHLKIAQVRNLADYLAEAKAANLWVYGAAAKGTPYRQPDYNGGVVLVMGAEGTGLRPRVRAMCDDVVSLPMRGHVDSLNVSAAAAVLLYGVLDARAAAK